MNNFDDIKFKCILKGEKITREICCIDFDNLEIHIKIAGCTEKRKINKVKEIRQSTGVRDIQGELMYIGDEVESMIYQRGKITKGESSMKFRDGYLALSENMTIINM